MNQTLIHSFGFNIDHSNNTNKNNYLYYINSSENKNILCLYVYRGKRKTYNTQKWALLCEFVSALFTWYKDLWIMFFFYFNFLCDIIYFITWKKKITQPTITKCILFIATITTTTKKLTSKSYYGEIDGKKDLIPTFVQQKKMCIIQIHSLCTNIPVSNTQKRQQQKIKLKRYCVFNLKFCTLVITCFILFFIIIIHFLLFIREWPTFSRW